MVLFGLAITMNGAIVADYITAGTLNANLIKTGVLSSVNYKQSKTGMSINLESGVIDTAGFKVNENGEITATAGKVRRICNKFKLFSERNNNTCRNRR